MKEDMVKLSEVLEKINGLKNGEFTQEDLDNWCSCIKFRASITTREKLTIIDKIILGYEYSENVVDTYTMMEMNKFWEGMLSYTNIDVSETELLNEDNYNILNLFLYNWILGYIKNDYKEFLRLFDSVWNYYLIESLSDGMFEGLRGVIEKIDDDGNKFIESIKNNKDILHDMAQVSLMNSPVELSKE